jgi:hypothetical protein
MKPPVARIVHDKHIIMKRSGRRNRDVIFCPELAFCIRGPVQAVFSSGTEKRQQHNYRQERTTGHDDFNMSKNYN